jgi:predicted secreted protein
MVVIGIETGVTGSHTWRLEIAAGHASQKIHSHGDESTTYFWVLELKKAS